MNQDKNQMEIGILIDGKYYPLEGVEKLLDLITDNIKKQVLTEISSRPVIEERNYTVGEVAQMVNKSTQTVTRHIRFGLLKAHKVGKSWLIPHESCLNYKYNKYE